LPARTVALYQGDAVKKVSFLPICGFLAWVCVSCNPRASTPPAHEAGSAAPSANTAVRSPDYDAAFWRTWGDGQAELASYRLVFPRYGAPREGVAVAIFVTEPFREDTRVKAENPASSQPGVFPVMKLNLMQDFPTGVYDYNLMTSSFIALQPVNGRPAGAAAKVSFSAQEWCGHVYHQLLFDAGGIRDESHSYFEGEADAESKLDYPAGGVSEDALLLWARRMAAPALEPGETVEAPLLMSLARARLAHRPLQWSNATFTRSAANAMQTIRVPAGSFEADVATVTVPDGTSWSFYIERAAPHRLLKWESSDGQTAELVASDRMKYWALNGPGGEKALERLGLRRRPPLTP
jgi:hypothetical protein